MLETMSLQPCPISPGDHGAEALLQYETDMGEKTWTIFFSE